MHIVDPYPGMVYVLPASFTNLARTTLTSCSGGGANNHMLDDITLEVAGGNSKADVLGNSGVPGKGLSTAPGLQKEFNPNSRAAEHAGKK